MQFLAVVLFLSGVLQVSHACSCAYYPGSSVPYWQSQMCIALKNKDRGGFLIEAAVGERKLEYPGSWWSDYVYAIKIMGPVPKELRTTVDMSKLYTAAFGSLCGVNLESGQKYVLSGFSYGGKLRVGSCNFIRKSEDITHDQKMFIKNKNLQDCPAQAYGCRCLPPRPGVSPICRAATARNGFVITAKVTGEKMRDMYWQAHYDINLTGYWNAAGLDGVDTSKVYMRRAGWGCEVNLMKGNNYMYILTGTIEDGKLMVGFCDFVKLWNLAEPEERQQVNNPTQKCPQPI